uniref:G_PROTEIN_RECEP_F1_2 domain-containing protein n=1 Tax=Angiostrongylus cantonensis TaxID=6313 RepID=A0A0K0DMM7_ANGCA
MSQFYNQIVMIDCEKAIAYIHFTSGHVVSFIHLVLSISAMMLILSIIIVNELHAFAYAIIQFLAAIVLCYSKMHKFAFDKLRIYCSSLTGETYFDVIVVHSALLAMLVITGLVFGLTFKLNTNLRKRISHNISQKYQATENLRVLRLFGPLLVLHFIGYPTYFGVSLLVQSIKNIVGNENFRLLYSILYFPCFYSVLSVVVLCYVADVMKRKKKVNAVFQRTSIHREDDIYFQNYITMWN